MYPARNKTGNKSNDSIGLHETGNIYLREQMKLLGKLTSNDTSNIGMIPSASKNVSINFT